MLVNNRVLVNSILTSQCMYTVHVYTSVDLRGVLMNCVVPSGLKLASPDLEFQISQALAWAIQMTVGTFHLALRCSGHIKVCHYRRT